MSTAATQTNVYRKSNDLLVSQALRTHEMQVWFLSEHLVDAPLLRVQ